MAHEKEIIDSKNKKEEYERELLEEIEKDIKSIIDNAAKGDFSKRIPVGKNSFYIKKYLMMEIN